MRQRSNSAPVAITMLSGGDIDVHGN